MWDRAPEKAGELVIFALIPVIAHKLGINTLPSPFEIKFLSADFYITGRAAGGQNPQKLPQPKINTKKVLK